MIGRTFAHYEVLDRLGAGGMGEVFRARDKVLGREVAVKFLPEKYASDPQRLARFEQEARSASLLNHPNIVTIHEVGQADGVPYIVMEVVEGRTLRDLIGSRPLPARRVLDIITQVTDGLAKAHSAGIVHRDLKPENVMVSQDGFVKILDFGLAKLRTPVSDPALRSGDQAKTDSVEILDTPETGPGVILGTVGYMSPEQAAGHEVDFRSDQFVVGSILYEMTTGRRAFRRATAVETLSAIIREQPDPVSASSPDVPPPLRWIIERCLAKDPADRYASTLDLARELRNVRDHLDEASALPTPSRGVPALRPPRHPFRVALALGALAFLSVLAVRPARARILEWLHLLPVPEQKQIAILAFVNAAGDATGQAFCDGLVETLTSKLTQLEQFQGSLWVLPASEVRQAKVASAAAARRLFGVTLVLTGSVQRSGDRVRLTANLVDAATLRQLRAFDIDSRIEDVALLQDGVVEKVARLLELELAPQARRVLTAGGTAVAGAYDLYLKGRGYLQRYEQEESLENAVVSFQHALEQDPGYALAYAGLGEAYWRRYNLTKRTEFVELAQKSCRRAVDLNDLLAPVHVTLGIIHSGTGEHSEAVNDFKRALDLDPRNADAHRELAYAYEALRRPSDAEGAYLKAIELRPTYWAGYNQLGAFYRARGRYAEAEVQFKRVIDLTPDNRRGYNNLGGLYELMGRHDEAESMLTRSISLEPTYSAYSNLGTLQFFRGHFADSARSFEQALKLDDRDYRVWRNLASAFYWAPGEREKARAAYGKAVELGEKQREVDPRDAGLLIRLADCYAMLGESKQAHAYATQALELAPQDVDVMFRAGSLHEHLGDRKQALEWIGKALLAGYSRAEVERAPALVELRADPRFRWPPQS